MPTEKTTSVKQNFSLKKEILKYLIHWKWFAVSVVSFLVLAIVFLKVKNPIFNNKSTILIKDAEEGRGLSELAAFKDFDALGGGGNDKNDEIEIINSYSLVSKVVDSLKLNVIQEAEIGLRNSDIFDITPITTSFRWNKKEYRKEIKALKNVLITLLDDNSYHLVYEKENIDITVTYDKKVAFEQGSLTISKSEFYEQNKNLINDEQLEPITEIEITIHPEDYFTTELQKQILVSAKTKSSNVLDVSLKHSNKQKANKLLDNLVYQYNKDAMLDKNQIAFNTDIFLDKRLAILSKELDSIERIKVRFKKDNELTDIKAESEIFIENIKDSDQKLMDLDIQLSLIRLMIKQLGSPERKNNLLPANIGLKNSDISALIVEYNKLALEKNKLLLESSTEFNPLVVGLNRNIESQRYNLVESLKNEVKNLELTRLDVNKQIAKIKSKIKSIPSIEKDYINIERQQNSKQNLYLFLLKKKEENSITMSVVSPVAKIIDPSSSSNSPVFPKPIMILALALVLGLIVPFGVIYFLEILNTKVQTIEDVKEIVGDVPLLGETIRIKKNETDVLSKNDRSSLGETFRIIRTNVNYFLENKKQQNKASKIFVTSSVKGEGKTFVSFNLMLSLVDTDKKVVIVGGDIRNPKLNRYLNMNRSKLGLTDYLNNGNLSADELINKVDFADRNFDVIASGRIPPNPSELLLNNRFSDLIKELEDSYDYIIVDTAPTMLVTDTFLMNEIADLNLYVLRSGYTEKDLLPYIKTIHKNKKIKNMALVLNDVKVNKSGYGYGYGYGESTSKWNLNIFKK